MTQYTDEEIIDKFIEFFETEGRWPKLRDMRTPYPSKTMIARRFCSEDGKADGFGRALTMAQIKYSQTYQLSDEYLGKIAEKVKNPSIFTRFMRWLGW
jgi:hypothetical protein